MEDAPKPAPLKVESEEHFKEALAKNTEGGIAVLNFYTDWAAPCKQMNQYYTFPPTTPNSLHANPAHSKKFNFRVFNELAGQSTNKTLFISIDAEAFPDLSETYDVVSVPYFVFLKDGTILEHVSGADPEVLRSAIGKYAGTKATLPPPQKTTAPAAEGPPEPAEHINVRLGKLVKAAPVMLFMKGTPATPECGFSRQMVALLRKHEIRYGFFNILADDEVRQGLKTFSDWPTYPQLYCHGTLIGGLDIVSLWKRMRGRERDEMANKGGMIGSGRIRKRSKFLGEYNRANSERRDLRCLKSNSHHILRTPRPSHFFSLRVLSLPPGVHVIKRTK